MALANVHVYQKDRATNRNVLTHINPTRTFCVGTPIEGAEPGKTMTHGSAWYTWQNGQWYGLGGNLIDEKDVPAALREQVVNVAFQDSDLASAPSITKVCKFCKETMNASQFDAHQEAHVEELLRGSASQRKASASA